MFTLFYRNLRLLILTIILIFVWGASSYFALPRLEDPELVNRVATVKTFLPGAKAERVEALITEKIEDELIEIAEIDSYESTSSTGSSIIIIELKDSITKDQVDPIWSRVQNKIDRIKGELPPGSTEPDLEQLKIKAYASIIALTWEQDEQPNYTILNRQATILKERLKNIPQTEDVDLFGDRNEEILVTVNPDLIASYSLTTADIARQIQQTDSKIAAGLLRNNQRDLLLEVAGELDTLERVKNIPLSFGNDGQFMRLRDVATVTRGVREPAEELTVISDRPGVTLAVNIASGSQIDAWATQADQILADFEAELPQAIQLRRIFNQQSYVSTRIDNLMLNLLFGGGLVFLVTLLLMGWRSALIVGTALPLSVLMVFGWLNLLEIPLHQMSITGLIVALGILIDNAIVMVDEVNKNLRQGLAGKAAIRQSLKHLSVPLLSSTLTTVLAFLPIALLPGATGEFVGAIGVSVILAVLSSLFLALTIIPTLTAKFNRQLDLSRASWWQTGISFTPLTRIYNQSLRWITVKPLWGIFLALLLPVTGFLQFPTLAQQFFPAADRDQIQIQLELPATAAIKQTAATTKQVRTALVKYPEITDVHWFIGSSAPRFYYNLAGSRERESNYAQALVQLNTIATSDLASQMQRELDRSFPEARIIVRQLEQGPPFAAPVEMRLFGSDITTLQDLGESVRGLLLQVSDITHTRASLAETNPQLEIEINEEEALISGLNRSTIAQQLDSTLEGTTGGSILESREELPVRVRLDGSNRSSLQDIASLDLLGNQANPIPLSSLGKTRLTSEISQISHYNGQRVNTVQGFLTPGVLPATALQEFKQLLNQLELPNGYYYQFGGEAEQKDSALGGLIALVGVLAVLMVAVLVMSLNSFRLAVIIGIVAIASFGLGIFAIWLFDYPFGFNPIIGTVGLIGVAINDSIVVMAAIQQDKFACRGDRKAIQQVVLDSTRHVITTTATTVFGFIPLLLGGGEFWPPLAIAIAGGVVGATLLALYLVPSAYILLINLKQPNSNWKGKASSNANLNQTV
ncbi:MAG: efflux RND transporter permease subunit [Cyanobacteria bacterium P01_C01_bin.72]